MASHNPKTDPACLLFVKDSKKLCQTSKSAQLKPRSCCWSLVVVPNPPTFVSRKNLFLVSLTCYPLDDYASSSSLVNDEMEWTNQKQFELHWMRGAVLSCRSFILVRLVQNANSYLPELLPVDHDCTCIFRIVDNFRSFSTKRIRSGIWYLSIWSEGFLKNAMLLEARGKWILRNNNSICLETFLVTLYSQTYCTQQSATSTWIVGGKSVATQRRGNVHFFYDF